MTLIMYFFRKIIILFAILGVINTSGQSRVVRNIVITGNKTTKTFIIHRELTVNIGDTLISSEIEKILARNKENLINTSLFIFVQISTKDVDSAYIDIEINLRERWYLWPNPILEITERNFNTWIQSGLWDKLNYGIFLDKQNFRGRKELLRVILRAGYHQELGLLYQTPYINKAKTLGLGFYLDYAQNHGTPVTSFDNKLIYKRMSIPAIHSFTMGFSFNYRRKIHNTFNLRIGYENTVISDSIIDLYPNFIGNANNSPFFSIDFKFIQDYRNEKSYPLTGHYINIEILKNGLGILSGNINQLNAMLSAKKYYRIAPKIYAATSVSGKYSIIPQNNYYYNSGLGFYNDFVRGYEYYVVDGEYFGVGKMDFKYAIIPERAKDVTWLKLNKFNKLVFALYGAIFFDAGYAKDIYFYQNNLLNNTFLCGGGIGLNLATYYDKVLRVELSMNKKLEKGVFLHFIAPI